MALEEVGAVDNRSLSRSRKEEVDAKLNETIELQDTRDNMRKENRIKYNRWKNEYDRGYDPIFKNELLDKGSIRLDESFVKRTLGDKQFEFGKAGRELHPPLVPRPHTTWERLQGDGRNNVTALLNETRCSSNLKDIVEAVRESSPQMNQTHLSMQKSRSEADFTRTGAAFQAAHTSSANQGGDSSRLHLAASASHTGLLGQASNRLTQAEYQSNMRQPVAAQRPLYSARVDREARAPVEEAVEIRPPSFRDLTKPSSSSGTSSKKAGVPSLNLTLNSNDGYISARANPPRTGGISVRTGASDILHALDKY